MRVGLFLKTDMEIGLCGISIFDIKDEPFYAIPDEKRNVEKLPLLGSMDGFVVNLYRVQRPIGKDKTKQADGIIILLQG